MLFFAQKCNSMQYIPHDICSEYEKLVLPITYQTISNCIRESFTLKQAAERLPTIIPAYSYQHEAGSREEFIARCIMSSLKPFEAAWHARRFKLEIWGESQDVIGMMEKSVYTAIMLRSICVSPTDAIVAFVNLGGPHLSDKQRQQILTKAYGDWDMALHYVKLLKSSIIDIFDRDTQEYLFKLRHPKKFCCC
jgi:hypothetical protein